MVVSTPHKQYFEVSFELNYGRSQYLYPPIIGPFLCFWWHEPPPTGGFDVGISHPGSLAHLSGTMCEIACGKGNCHPNSKREREILKQRSFGSHLHWGLQLSLLPVAEGTRWLVLDNNPEGCPRERMFKWFLRDSQTLYVTVKSMSVFHMIHWLHECILPPRCCSEMRHS